MRGLFSMLGLLLTLAVVGMVVRQQMSAAPKSLPGLLPVAATPASGSSGASATAPVNVLQQSQQLQQQTKQAIEDGLRARPMPDAQ